MEGTDDNSGPMHAAVAVPDIDAADTREGPTESAAREGHRLADYSRANGETSESSSTSTTADWSSGAPTDRSTGVESDGDVHPQEGVTDDPSSGHPSDGALPGGPPMAQGQKAFRTDSRKPAGQRKPRYDHRNNIKPIPPWNPFEGCALHLRPAPQKRHAAAWTERPPHSPPGLIGGNFFIEMFGGSGRTADAVKARGIRTIEFDLYG